MLVHELPVYNDTYQLVLLIHKLTEGYPKLYKHTLGEILCKGSAELFVPIQLANRAEDSGSRVKYLERFFLCFETVKIQLRLSHDLKCISTSQYAQVVELTSKIGKQITGWINSSKKR